MCFVGLRGICVRLTSVPVPSSFFTGVAPDVMAFHDAGVTVF
jgi:hypothetical protein